MVEKPRWCAAAQSVIAAQSAPDCETSASRPRGGGLAEEGGVEIVHRAHDAEAIRADEADVGVARGVGELRLEPRAGLARLVEAGGEDDRGADALLAAFADRLDHGARRRRDNRELRGRLDVVDAREAVAAADRLVARD